MKSGKILTILIVATALIVLLIRQNSSQDTVEKTDVVQSAESVPETVLQDTKGQQNDEISISRQNAITRAVEMVSPAVVGISTKSYQQYIPNTLLELFYYGNNLRQEVSGLGSGFIISSDGYILTNDHVVGEAREISVALTDSNTYQAQLVESDRSLDLALLKIEGENFPSVNFGDSDDIIIGEWAISLGNPFGLFNFNNQPAVTVGVISALGRDLGGQQGESYNYQDMIQTDASINPGNSGGPLVNSAGDVIGMNTVIYTGGSGARGSIGIGFAVPVNSIKAIVEDLKNQAASNSDWWIGFTGNDVNSRLAYRLGLQQDTGILILRVVRFSPAEKANLQQGDVIIELNGNSVQNLNDIGRIIQQADPRPGRSFQLQVIRNNQLYETTLVLERPPRR